MRLMEEAKNDAELVLLFQQGQEWAFEELFQRYKQAAMRSAFLLTGNYFDAENVLQEAFIKCYQNWPASESRNVLRPGFGGF